MDKRVKSLVGLILIIGSFILISYIIQTNLGFIESYFDLGVYGMIIFIILVVLSIVLAPVSVIPIFPIATVLWGWRLAGLLGFIGWMIGAVIAFFLARIYGVRLVGHLIPLEPIYRFEKKIPRDHLFLTVVFFRIITPIDGVSYFVGLFTRMSFVSYFFASFIGLFPFSFVVAYLGSVPLNFQILFFSLALVLFMIVIMFTYYRDSRKRIKKKKAGKPKFSRQ